MRLLSDSDGNDVADLAHFLTQRPIVIALAIAGAGMAMAGSVLEARKGRGYRGALLLTRIGYGVAFASVLLFIVAGFLSE